MDNDTLVKIYAGFAVVVAALITVCLGFYFQIKIKQFEGRAQLKKEQAAHRLTLYLPLLRFAYEFDSRIGRILANLDTDWLDGNHLARIRSNEGFAKNPKETGYFIMSSVYVFACFFGWAEAIKTANDATKIVADKPWYRRALSKTRRWIREQVFGRISRPEVLDPDIHIISKLFQYQELFKAYIASRKLVEPRDACKLHRHLQHSIGEMMLQRDGQIIRCKTFREFSEAYRDERFRYWFVALEELFVDLSHFVADKDVETQAEMKNDIRPLRLLAIRYWCRVMMRKLASDLEIETPQPEDVLSGLSAPLRQTITSVKMEQLELHMLGVSLSVLR